MTFAALDVSGNLGPQAGRSKLGLYLVPAPKTNLDQRMWCIPRAKKENQGSLVELIDDWDWVYKQNRGISGPDVSRRPRPKLQEPIVGITKPARSPESWGRSGRLRAANERDS